MRQRNEWTTEKCHRLASRQLEEPTQLQRDDIEPWVQLPYECRMYWTREGTKIKYRNRDSASVLDAEMTAIRVAL